MPDRPTLKSTNERIDRLEERLEARDDVAAVAVDEGGSIKVDTLNDLLQRQVRLEKAWDHFVRTGQRQPLED